jgi:peptidoglycan/xylan/chitin deacetylase (PgdA/CDA1 family)
MGQPSPVGEICGPADLESVVGAGHEVACHTFDHVLCSGLRSAALVGNCQRNRQRIAEELNGYGLRNFSFPEGVVTLGAKSTLSAVYVTCRTIEPGINRDPVDFAFLRANRIYSRFGIGHLREMIRKNAEQQGWLILYTHDVIESPSPYGCTPKEFGEVLDCAVASHADILSIAEATERFQTIPTTRDGARLDV